MRRNAEKTLFIRGGSVYTERRFVKSYADGKGAKDMTLSLQDFLSSLVSNPMLILTVLLLSLIHIFHHILNLSPDGRPGLLDDRIH